MPFPFGASLAPRGAPAARLRFLSLPQVRNFSDKE
jgi:hypothetical protein